LVGPGDWVTFLGSLFAIVLAAVPFLQPSVIGASALVISSLLLERYEFSILGTGSVAVD